MFPSSNENCLLHILNKCSKNIDACCVKSSVLCICFAHMNNVAVVMFCIMCNAYGTYSCRLWARNL